MRLCNKVEKIETYDGKLFDYQEQAEKYTLDKMREFLSNKIGDIIPLQDKFKVIMALIPDSSERHPVKLANLIDFFSQFS